MTPDQRQLLQLLEAQVFEYRYRNRLTPTQMMEIRLPDLPEMRDVAETASHLVAFRHVVFKIGDEG